MNTLNRREFVAACAGAGAALAASVAGAAPVLSGEAAQPEGAARPSPRPGDGPPGDSHRGKVIISSGNGLPATARAMELLDSGTYLLDALVAGVALVEDDPKDDSVGYGGLPNEEGVVELDASVMDGPMHRAGAVGALRNVKNPAAVALQVLRKTDHVMIVGEGALRFARAMGFKEQELLTEHAREEWLKWKANLNRSDKWLNEEQQIRARPGPTGPRSQRLDDETRGGVRYTTGTIHCSAVTGGGDLASVTSTSGLSWKIPGRLGDSPIVGAGMYCDNAIGSAGATGRGESLIQVCGAFSIVQHMEAGMTPTEACLAVLKRIADRTREPRLLDDRGRPAFSARVYAVRKDGAYGSASIWNDGEFAVNDGTSNRREPCAFLFERDRRG
ncbi:MAG: N(4)-(beta-N-acetylglucosaminyl)-L-asparaginase [Phycisphaerales bacterium]